MKYPTVKSQTVPGAVLAVLVGAARAYADDLESFEALTPNEEVLKINGSEFIESERAAWKACESHRLFGVTYDQFLKKEGEDAAKIAAVLVEPPAQTEVFVVQGDHWSVGGRPMSIHTTREGADAAAAGMVNTMLGDLDLPTDAGAATWKNYLETVIRTLEDRDLGDGGDCDVWIDAVELHGSFPAHKRQALPTLLKIAEQVDEAHVEDAGENLDDPG
jgi:hypothetical protein